MAEPALTVRSVLLQGCLSWFQEDFRQRVVSLIEGQFPGYALPNEVQSVLTHWAQICKLVEVKTSSNTVDVAALFEDSSGQPAKNLSLFKEIILRYRRERAAKSEEHREKTFHAGLIQTVDEEITALDAMVATEWFQRMDPLRLPRAKDFLPVQYIEQSTSGQRELSPRQYDEKFHILQSPALFLADLAYFRAKCEVRDAPLTVAFIDIDDFKNLNSANSETKVDRNVLPRLMQTLEAHLYHHGFAYRAGGDEYLVLVPSLSNDLVLAFLDDLRRKIAGLQYSDIVGATTVSIGVCYAEPDCSLTDRELRERANEAKKFAKAQGKNCIAGYGGHRLIPAELRTVRPEKTGE